MFQNRKNDVNEGIEICEKIWDLLITYPVDEEGYILIDTYESLLSAGNYDRYTLSVGDSRIILAVDSGNKISFENYIGEIKAIFKNYYNVFGKMPGKNIIVVFNQNREKFNEYSYHWVVMPKGTQCNN